MIRYALNCSNEHAFEGWFRNGEAFEHQAQDGQIACPTCGDRAVRKAMMAPAVMRSLERQLTEPTPPKTLDPDQVRAAMMLALVRKVREHVEKNFDDVGDRFPEEVRRIHYGEAEERDIYGKASLEEAKELLEEGIPIRPLPDLPELDG